MRAAELDGRTDLYALGGVLFEMLTGQTAFEAESYEGWGEHHRFTIPLPPSKIRPELAEWRGLDDLVIRLLAKDRDQRPYDVAEVLRLLDAVEYVPTPVRRPDPPQPAPPPIPVPPPPVPVKRVPSWLWIAGVLLIVMAAFSAGRLLNSNNSQDNPTQNTTQNQQADHTQPDQPQGQANSPQPGSESQTAESPKPSRDTQPFFSQINPQANAPSKPASSGASAAALDTQAEGYYNQKNYTEAAPLFDQACSGGSMRACTFLGFMYEHGQGVGRDSEKAVRLYNTACDGDFATACRDLGPVYTDGEPGIPKDEARAASYNLKACNLGEFDGCAGAGWDYYRGIGVGVDFQRAASLLTKSCDGNSAYGCNDLGVLYNRGEGVTEDQGKAATLFQRACTGGDPHGCSNLGDSYRYGRGGLPVDTAKAKELLSKGCSMGNQWGCDQLKQMQ
jgi:TPR repeat protein